jgi:hypothetical protein
MLTLDDVNGRIDRHLQKRRLARGRFTLADLSKEIGYSVQQISDVRRGRRTLTSDFAQRVKDLTDLKPEDHTSLTPDQLEATRDVVHYHIMSLSKLHDQRADPAWIAARLGIDPARATAAFERLIRLGLVRVEGERFEQTEAHFTTAGHATTETMGRRYEQHSQIGFKAFYERAQADRSFAARTFAIPRARLDEAKAIIRNLLMQLDELEQSGADDVYTCLVQLFPVTAPASAGTSEVSNDAP